MTDHQLTPEDEKHIQELKAFRAATKTLSDPSDPKDYERAREFVNKHVETVRELVGYADCLKRLTISPPPAIGGYVMENVDPFNFMFENVWGRSLRPVVVDMIDSTLGVIESGRFAERKAKVLAGLERRRLAKQAPTGKKVFVVHGHDEGAKESIARFLEKLGFEPIILHEQASGGRTIIEKVEHYGEVAFAVVLLTPDDIGGSISNPEVQQPRARQNVILELGYFIGRLGRPHVTALVKEGVERPSDIDGVVYVAMDSTGGWRVQVAREMKAAGLDVDLNLAV